MQSIEVLKKKFARISGFPTPGITFWDMTPILEDTVMFSDIIDQMCAIRALTKSSVTKIASPEARGFILGAAVAAKLNIGFVPIRKPGKLPRKVLQERYSLEYGSGALEMHYDAINQNDQVLFIDDVLATGGTALASARLIEKKGGRIVAMMFLAELTYALGRSMLSQYQVSSLVQFNDDDLKS